MVLMIVGLLLGGLLVPLSAQMEQQKISTTEKLLDEAREALIGFAISNGRLPCPADGTIATGQTNAGVEAYNTSTNTCTNLTGSGSSQAAGGVLPWATLGVSETDAWGRRFTYRVTAVFADAISLGTLGSGCSVPIPTQSSFALCSSGNLNVLTAAGTTNYVATGIPAMVVSHGTNGLGAYTPAGQQIAPVPAATTDEGNNADNDNNFVSHTATPDYDDLVTWISNNILLNRMVEAGKLP